MKRKGLPAYRRGFTFIELLVTLGIALLLFSGLIAGYNQFTDTTRIRQTALTLKNDLRLAQNKAIIGEKPFKLPCDTLEGYEVTFTATSYEIQAQCVPDQEQAAVTTVTLPPNILFSPVPQSLLFKVLSQGVNIDTDTTITISSGGRKFDLTINPQGVISEAGFQ